MFNFFFACGCSLGLLVTVESGHAFCLFGFFFVWTKKRRYFSVFKLWVNTIHHGKMLTN